MKKERRARATPSQLQVADMKASCLETGNASRTRKELIKDVTSNGFPVRGAFEKWLMIYRYDEINPTVAERRTVQPRGLPRSPTVAERRRTKSTRG